MTDPHWLVKNFEDYRLTSGVRVYKTYSNVPVSFRCAEKCFTKTTISPAGDLAKVSVAYNWNKKSKACTCLKPVTGRKFQWCKNVEYMTGVVKYCKLTWLLC